MQDLSSHVQLQNSHTHLAGMTLSAASTYSPHNIRVNMVVPGLVISQLLQLKFSLVSFTSANWDLPLPYVCRVPCVRMLQQLSCRVSCVMWLPFACADGSKDDEEAGGE